MEGKVPEVNKFVLLSEVILRHFQQPWRGKKEVNILFSAGMFQRFRDGETGNYVEGLHVSAFSKEELDFLYEK